MAEAPKIKLKSTKKAAKDFEKKIAEHKTDQTIQWFLGLKLAGTSTKYNQWADRMWSDLAVHFCILDSSFTIKQYSTTYSHLTKINAGWKGFYPSQYNVKVLIDEDGNMGDKKIVDTDELAKVPQLKRGGTFYFANIKYKVSKMSANLDNWELLAEDTKDTKEGIFIRKTGDAYLLFNFALQTHTTRQFYGSAPKVAILFQKYINQVILDEDNPNFPYTEVNDDVELE